MFHRPTAWNSKVQCSTKTLARLFSNQNYRVTYLQSNIHLGHLFFRKGYYEYWKTRDFFDGNIWITSSLSLVPLSINGSHNRLLAKAHYKSCIPSLYECIQRGHCTPPDYIWTTIPGSTVLKSIFPESKVVFHSIDNYSAYNRISIKSLEKIDYREADHVFTIGEIIKKSVISDSEIKPGKVTNLGQGVDTIQYQNKSTPPSLFSSIGRPIAIWTGVTRKIDRNLLSIFSKKMRQLGGSVLIIGPSCDWLPGYLESHSNAIHLGPVPSEQLPPYLQHSDIGLMLYDQSPSKQSIYMGQNPLKLYEYAAAGLPTLSTPHEEFRFIQPPIKIVRKGIEIEQAVNNLLQYKQEYQQKMKEFSNRHTWQSIVKRANSILRDL